VTARYIADKSALARLALPGVRVILKPLILSGQVATCSVIELAVLYSTRGPTDLARTRQIRAQAFPLIPILQADFDRAVQVLELLAQRGQHREVGLADLLIAAVAERASLCLLHYGADFDAVAAVTGQVTRWVVPRGPL
jgi:predicted nucleic acid-binding protein